MHDEAIEVRAKAHDLHVDWRWTLGHSYAVAGRHEEARKIAEEIKTDPHPIDTWGLAEIYAALGDKDEAFHWLEEGYKVRFSWIPWIASNPNYESLRDRCFKKMHLFPACLAGAARQEKRRSI